MDNVEFDNAKAGRVPRLSIANLMVLTLFAGIGLAAFRNMEQSNHPESLRTASAVASVIYGIAVGISAGGTTILMSLGIRNKYFPLTAPGHRLLSSQAIMLIPLIGFAIFSHQGEAGVPTAYFALLAGAAVVQFILLSVAALASKTRMRWRILLCLYLFFTMSQFVYAIALIVAFGFNEDGISNPIAMRIVGLLGFVSQWHFPILGVATSITACVDYTLRDRHDWLHWLSVITAIGLAVGSAVIQIALFLVN